MVCEYFKKGVFMKLELRKQGWLYRAGLFVLCAFLLNTIPLLAHAKRVGSLNIVTETAIDLNNIFDSYKKIPGPSFGGPGSPGPILILRTTYHMGSQDSSAIQAEVFPEHQVCGEYDCYTEPAQKVVSASILNPNNLMKWELIDAKSGKTVNLKTSPIVYGLRWTGLPTQSTAEIVEGSNPWHSFELPGLENNYHLSFLIADSAGKPYSLSFQKPSAFNSLRFEDMSFQVSMQSEELIGIDSFEVNTLKLLRKEDYRQGPTLNDPREGAPYLGVGGPDLKYPSVIEQLKNSDLK